MRWETYAILTLKRILILKRMPTFHILHIPSPLLQQCVGTLIGRMFQRFATALSSPISSLIHKTSLLLHIMHCALYYVRPWKFQILLFIRCIVPSRAGIFMFSSHARYSMKYCIPDIILKILQMVQWDIHIQPPFVFKIFLKYCTSNIIFNIVFQIYI